MSGKRSLVFRASLVSHRRLGTWRQTALFLSCVWKRELIVTLALSGCDLWERTKKSQKYFGAPDRHHEDVDTMTFLPPA